MSIERLKVSLGQGQRSNKFRLFLHFPDGVSPESDILCTQASFPGMNVQSIEVYFQGRKITLPSHVEYDGTWSVTFYQTEDHNLRKRFIQWSKQIDDFEKGSSALDVNDVMITQEVHQLNASGVTSAQYLIKDLYPSGISSIELSNESQNNIQTFEVTFQFSSWEVIK